MMDAGGYKIQRAWARGHFAAGEAKGETKGEAKGKAAAKSAAVITVLEARGLAVPEELRQRVLSTSDLGELERWLRRAAVVGAAEEIFVSGGD